MTKNKKPWWIEELERLKKKPAPEERPYAPSPQLPVPDHDDSNDSDESGDRGVVIIDPSEDTDK